MAVLGLIIVVGLAGCGSGGGSTTRAAVYLTDASDGTYSSVVVTIEGIQIHEETRGWVSLPGSFPMTVDLLTLQYQQQLLGSVVLEPGTYTQTRMILSSEPGANQVTLASDSSVHDITIPSSAQTGIKLIGNYSLSAGETTALVIDFCPDKVIHITGNGEYKMKSTIPLIFQADALSQYGAIAGVVAPAEAWETAVVSAYSSANDALVASTGVIVPAEGDPAAETDGTFRIMLPAGDYYLIVTADAYDPFDTRPTTYPVTTGADTDAGTITLTLTP
jgi:hypothetical protein